jgi:hypothetical protein
MLSVILLEYQHEMSRQHHTTNADDRVLSPEIEITTAGCVAVEGSTLVNPLLTNDFMLV